MASEYCMNCFSVKGQYEVCPYCGYVEGTPQKQPHFLTPGTILNNRFIVGMAIGAGGFGITYKCWDNSLGITVAIKEFYPVGLVNRAPGESKVGLLSGEKQKQYHTQLKRFLMEARSIAQFGKAKDIVNVYDFFEENNTAYIIMEHIDGVLLKDYLEKSGRLSVEAALGLITPIIEAVKKIHSKGIIHRDVSPDNIFISSENSIKLFDFGSASFNNGEKGMDGEKVIKVGYSAPEQYRESSRQSFYTDIYSIGAILYQMITGVKPVESAEREYKDTLKSPLELGIKINSNLDRAIMEAMAVRPELRFQSVQHLEEALYNKRIAEYPKDKIKKVRRKRNWIIGVASSLVAATIVVVFLSMTVMKKSNPIFDYVLSEDTITIWVENESQKEALDSLANDGFKGKNTDKVNDESQKMYLGNEKIEVVVSVKPDMEAALTEAKSAKKEDEMPDMFITDHVANVDDYHLESLDNVYSEIKDQDKQGKYKYKYMSQYKNYFKDMKEMPTGIDTLILYACEIDNGNNDNNDDDDNLKSSSLYNKEPLPDKEDAELPTKEISEIIGGDGKEQPVNISDKYYFYGDSEELAAILINDSWSDVFSEKITPDIDMSEALYKMKNLSMASEKKKYMISKTQDNEQQGVNHMYGNNIIGNVALRKYINESENNGDKNRISNYKAYFITCDGKRLVTFAERYAINADSSENKKMACMRFLSFMLTDKAQGDKQGPYKEMSYPIYTKQFDEFANYNSDITSFNGMPECVIVGKLSGKIYEFNKGIDGYIMGLGDKPFESTDIKTYLDSINKE